MTRRQTRQLDRLRDCVNKDPYLSPEERRKQIQDFAQIVLGLSADEITDYLNAHFDTAEAALERHRAAAAFMAGQPPS